MEVIRGWFNRQLNNPQVVSLALVLLAAWVLITYFGNILAPVLVACVLAYLLEGVVAVGERRLHLPRYFAAMIVWLLFVAVMFMALITITPRLSAQATQVVQEVPTLVGNVQAYMITLPEKYPSFVTPEQVEDMLAGAGDYVAAFQKSLLSNSFELGVTVIYAGIYLVLVPLMMLFMMKDKVRLQQWFRRFLPNDIGLIQTVWSDVDQQLANYVRGKFVEIVLVWAAAFIMFRLFGLNYAVLLSALVGFSVLVPYLGALVVTIPIAAVALTQFGASAHTAWVLVGYGILQAIDGNLLVPLLFSEAVDLHPVAIIVAVLFFGGIWGFWGVFFAIPLATVVHAVINAWPKAAPSVVSEPTEL